MIEIHCGCYGCKEKFVVIDPESLSNIICPYCYSKNVIKKRWSASFVDSLFDDMDDTPTHDAGNMS